MNGVIINYMVKVVQSIEPTVINEVRDRVYDLTLYTCTTGGQ